MLFYETQKIPESRFDLKFLFIHEAEKKETVLDRINTRTKVNTFSRDLETDLKFMPFKEICAD